MPAALFPASDYRDALLKLLPRGRVWPKEPGSLHYQVTDGLAPTFERLDGRAQTLLYDAFPPNTVELLAEWEASLGLPDPCDGPNPTIQQRRAQVLVKLFEGGGQSVPYYLAVLERLGYVGATITEFAPYRAGISTSESPVCDDEWWHVWQVNLPELAIFYFEADISTTDTPEVVYAEQAVFCVLAEIKPAHTFVFFTSDP